MCLIVIAWQVHPAFPLVVAANRDEWRDRPAEPAHFWPDHPELLAGRDLKAGGTWMGITKSGRFAAVTNFRDPSDRRNKGPSRGALVSDFLLGVGPPETFLGELAPRASQYDGFNLIVGDRDALFYFGSRQADAHAITAIAPGIHGLSNHVLDEPWPKVGRARAAMIAAAADAEPAPRLFAMLSDTVGAPDEDLPDTGVGLEMERFLAPPLIIGPAYGTRASTVLTVAIDGRAALEERTLDASGHPTETRTFTF